ncbi:MAG TPA: hypothetical protein VMZ11_00965 [Mycobacteriales bacterium]|nr:hypothetical protein [Mycobacteriales bacterium]
MSTIEEPNSTTEPTGLDDDVQLIDVDDVEGHGMREVAAGLGAAAVLAGGGTAAAAAVGVHPTLPNLHPSTPSVSHPIDQVDRATDWTIDTSRDVRDGAIGTTGATAAGAGTLANRELGAAGATVTGAERSAASVVDATGTIARNEVRVAGQSVAAAEAVAVNVAKVTTGGAVTTASSTTSHAASTAGGTVTSAARKTATLLTLTTSTVNAMETTIVATVANLNPNAGAGTSGMGSTGWVTFSLGGENIASVQLSHGQASVTVKTISLAGKALQAVYSGDTIHASSMRAITL